MWDRGLAQRRQDGAAPAVIWVSSLQPLGGQQSVREHHELYKMPLNDLPVDFDSFLQHGCELSCASLSPGEGIGWCGER